MLQGPATALAPAYQFLRDGLSTVGLVVQPRKSWLFSHDAEAAASLAASLGIPHSAEGMVVAGCMFVCVCVCYKVDSKSVCVCVLN